LKDKPFALIGVNVGGNAKNLKDVMKKEGLTWRSFADLGDAGQGAIAARWNLTSTPTLYVLDARGVIRYKWPGSPGPAAVDSALDTLIREAGRKDPPK
jgi:hypothetical protein